MTETPSEFTSDPTPYTVIGGYLGAGKTTLLNQLLRSNESRRIAVIVNDFGDIPIDADLIVDRDGDTITLANGCICCSISDGMMNVLDALRARIDDIDHVVVEASGVSDPARIGDYATPFGFELRGVIVLADAEQVRTRARDKYVGSTVVAQLRGADLLVLTKGDLIDAVELREVRSWLAELAPGVPIVGSKNGVLPTAIALGDIEISTRSWDDRNERPGVHALDYDTWSTVLDSPIDRAGFDAFVDALPVGVLRAKGVVRFADDPEIRYVFHAVGGRSTVIQNGPWGERPPATQLVVLALAGALDDIDLDRVMASAASDQDCAAQLGAPRCAE